MRNTIQSIRDVKNMLEINLTEQDYYAFISNSYKTLYDITTLFDEDDGDLTLSWNNLEYMHIHIIGTEFRFIYYETNDDTFIRNRFNNDFMSFYSYKLSKPESLIKIKQEFKLMLAKQVEIYKFLTDKKIFEVRGLIMEGKLQLGINTLNSFIDEFITDSVDFTSEQTHASLIQNLAIKLNTNFGFTNSLFTQYSLRNNIK